MEKRVKHLVVDSGALIMGAPIHEYAENIYTVSGVIKEIKDRATLQRLRFLPYTLHIKEPFAESCKHIMDFSKKTGDYGSLSAVDQKLLALTYQLEKENVGTEHLNKDPKLKVQPTRPASHDTKIVGFFVPKEKSEDKKIKPIEEKGNLSEDLSIGNNGVSEETKIGQNQIDEEDKSCLNSDEVTDCVSHEEGVELNDLLNSLIDQEDEEKGHLNEDLNIGNNGINEETNIGENQIDEEDTSSLNSEEVTDCVSDVEEEEEKSESDDDEESDWITPKNISEIKGKMDGLKLNASAVVACITTDYSMQNVLIQMGLNVISVDGMLIKRTHVFILRCYSCYKTTGDSTKVFCPNCGNNTLKRVSVTVSEDGTKRIHINFKKPIPIRGTRYSIPLPKRGKHQKNPIVCADQPVPQNRPSKNALRKLKVLDEDYVAEASPFLRNDVYSRAFHLGIRPSKTHQTRRNPNEPAKRIGRKKHKKNK
ncbi:RNA-binding protein NOB1 [Trichonephila inaurata madagascariensis]|uniref:RNA-binding protein NOB1 n=1 Tax=Trichonephila inaurata madagascariensis TaxID=2747483 RepID=A0A8X6XC75_9ARAC|nr:RNA-binding protein NOB1 [Trichonephila inaurata madagascariensis]